MTRTLNTQTLDGVARWYASNWLSPARIRSKTVEGLWVGGQDFVAQELAKIDYLDEREYVTSKVRSALGSDFLSSFDAMAKGLKPRTPEEHAARLADKLAVDPSGKHIDGKIGRVQVGSRFVGMTSVEVEHPSSVRLRRLRGISKAGRFTHRKLVPHFWPIYAGEEDERASNSGVADPLPIPPLVGAAADFTISNECALLGLNAIVDNLDEGSGAAVIQGRTGTKPTDVDTTVSGTLLFTCVMTDPAFGNAADATPNAIATAASIADDTSADATDTLGYCRVSSTNDGATPLDDHMDLNADTSGGDINFNTLSIVSGGTVSITSFTVTLPEQA